MADNPVLSLNEAQLQKILASISTQRHQWWPVASVFVSALLAMLVGILLDRFRAWRDRIKAIRERQEDEIRQINAVISGLTFDLERLLHISAQNILPHYRDAQAIHTQMMIDFENDDHIRQVIKSQYKYPAVFMTCPDMYLIEYDFAKELPFVIERDPELVKHSGWLIASVREIKDVTARRNHNIEDAFSLSGLQDGAHNLANFRLALRTQASIANTECVVATQLFEVLLRLANGLVTINQNYKLSAKKSRFTPPDALAATMKELKDISEKTPIHFLIDRQRPNFP
jgi:hypothetical protein